MQKLADTHANTVKLVCLSRVCEEYSSHYCSTNMPQSQTQGPCTYKVADDVQHSRVVLVLQPACGQRGTDDAHDHAPRGLTTPQSL